MCCRLSIGCADAHFSRVPHGRHYASEGAQAETSAPPPVTASLLAKPGEYVLEFSLSTSLVDCVTEGQRHRQQAARCCRRSGIALGPLDHVHHHRFLSAIRLLLVACFVCCAARVEGSHLQHLPAHRDPSRHRRRSVQAWV